MKIYISVDIEGICGVVNSNATGPKGHLYASAIKQMTAEANAAVEGAFAAGATEVVLNDSHGPQTNLLLTELHPDAKIIYGNTKPMIMMEGISSDYDGAMFIGYHARSNARGILSHTLNSSKVDNVWINDMLLGETGINALVAGCYQVPVILVSGDDTLCREAKELLGNVTTVTVKEAITRYSAKCLHPTRAVEQIRSAAEQAVKNISNYKPLQYSGPFTVKVQFLNSGMADGAMRMPGAKRVAGDTVAYSADDFLAVYKAFGAMVSLA